ncbi:hypothetical protein [Streptomyces sp. NPDC091040]|uniref:hypothetical protein n=1 Tax=Streptomyces sp. NPDC091040 TaxID=3365972 RepID=UPI0037F42DC8
MRTDLRPRTKRVRQGIVSVAAAVAVIGGINFALAPSASASGYGCSGSVVYSKNLMVESKAWSTAYLYYSSANGGTNCAVLVAKKWAGTRHFMHISIQLSGVDSGLKKDEGQFTSYAGPVTLTHTNGHCISGTMWENSPDDNTQAGAAINKVACG